MKKTHMLLAMILAAMPAFASDYRVIVKNNCPNRIWYRLALADSFIGKEIAPGESQEVDTGAAVLDIQGQQWEKGEASKWNPTFKGLLETEASSHRVTLTPIFGPRPAQSIKVFMACLAGPADPLTRNDIALIDGFAERGVPRENIWMLLERQATPSSISATLTDAASGNVMAPDDILFLYLGGHGSASDQYYLGTWQGGTSSSLVLKAIEDCPGTVFMVVDSCYSGRMIDDAKEWFAEREKKPRLSILTSIQADRSATTGWKLIGMLLDEISGGKYITPKSVGQKIAATLRTSTAEQRAQYYSFY